jgi:RNA polymerase sigma-70 factor (ECF subfamily)
MTVLARAETTADAELVQGLIRRDPAAVRRLTTLYNQRLYRTAWSILRNRAEAEEALQEAYLKAFEAIGRFEHKSSLATWLTRIVINEALGRRRAEQRRMKRLSASPIVIMEEYRDRLMGGAAAHRSPEAALARKEAARLLETAIAALPEPFRLVFVLRAIEGLSVEETAEALGVRPETVKTRHLRARRRLQEALDPELAAVFGETLAFAGLDCAAMTERVLARLGLTGDAA